jgi:hypothetical protein
MIDPGQELNLLLQRKDMAIWATMPTKVYPPPLQQIWDITTLSYVYPDFGVFGIEAR